MKDPSIHISNVLYRPFDVRPLFYHHSLVRWPVYAISRHMLAGSNFALAIGRAGQAADTDDWNVITCSNTPAEFNLFRRGGNNLFPLYLYPSKATDETTASMETERRPNLSPL